MITASLAIGGILLFLMIALSWYGAVTLPQTARIPVHWGFGYNQYVSKRTGLIVWPAAGVLVYGLLGGLAGNARWAHGAPLSGWASAVFMAVIMGALAAFQVGALAVASRRSRA